MHLKRQATTLLMLAALLLAPLVASAPLSLALDKEKYHPGETVTLRIQGKPNTVYGIQVVDPVGALVTVKQVTSDSDGKATFSFTLLSDCRLGTYTIYVAGGEEAASITFQVEAAPPPPAPPPPAPAAVAAAALSAARSRLLLLLRVYFSLNQSLSLLGLGGALVNVSREITEVNVTLTDADAKYAAGDYDAARNLALAASSRIDRLISLAFELSVSALKSFLDGVKGLTRDWLVLALLSSAEERLTEVSPIRVEDSLRSLDLASKMLLAARRLTGAAQLEARSEELARKLVEAEKTLEALLKEAEELKSRVGRLESENAQLSRSLSEAESSLATARSELERLRTEIQRLRERNAELEQQAAAAQSEANIVRVVAVGLLAAGLAAGFAGGYIIRARRRSA